VCVVCVLCVCVCFGCVCVVCVVCVCVCVVCVDQNRWQADTCSRGSGDSGRLEWMSDCQRGASDMLSEICALPGYCPTYNGNSLPTFRDRLPVGLPSCSGHFLDFLALEDGTDMLSRNVGKKLPLHAA